MKIEIDDKLFEFIKDSLRTTTTEKYNDEDIKHFIAWLLVNRCQATLSTRCHQNPDYIRNMLLRWLRDNPVEN